MRIFEAFIDGNSIHEVLNEGYLMSFFKVKLENDFTRVFPKLWGKVVPNLDFTSVFF